MFAGRDYIGVGVGAIVFNQDQQVFLAKRGFNAKNERGCWEFPGGSVEYGEILVNAAEREFYEEYEMKIEVLELLCVTDHILPEENQHWISLTYVARQVGGIPRIVEPEKCTAIGWFPLSDLPKPLSMVSMDGVRQYRKKYKLDRKI